MLVKLFNISKFVIIDSFLFSNLRFFNFLSCYYTLLFFLISTVQENNKKWKLSEDYIALD